MTKSTVESGAPWRATLDGKQVLYAQQADDHAGYVLAPLIDAAGNPIFDFSRDNYAVVRREGKVEVLGSAFQRSERAAIAADDNNPFRVEQAREGELSADYARRPVGPLEGLE